MTDKEVTAEDALLEAAMRRVSISSILIGSPGRSPFPESRTFHEEYLKRRVNNGFA